MGHHDKVIAWVGGLVGWGGAIFANLATVEAFTRILAGLAAAFASIATGAYFLRKYLRDK